MPNPWEKYQSNTATSDGPWTKYKPSSGDDDKMLNLPKAKQQSLSDMFKQHPFQTIGKATIEPAEKTLTGRSIEDKTKASLLKEAGNTNFKGMNPSEVKNKLSDIEDISFKKMLGAQLGDMLTTPINYVGGKAVEEGAKGLIKGVHGVGKLAGFESGRIINSLIKPAEKAFNFGKNPGDQIVKEKIVANSMEDLETKIKSKLDEATQTLKQRIGLAKTLGGTGDYSGMLKPIDDAIANAKRLPKTNEALITRLENAKSDLLLNKDLTKLSPDEAVQLKRDIGDVTKWTKEGSDDATANKALKQAYHSVKTTLEEKIPGIKEDNARLANLIDADVAVSKRNIALQKAGFTTGLFQKGALLTSTLGVLTGNVHEIAGGLAYFGATKIMESPAAKTRVAQWLMNLSQSDLAKAFSEMPQLRTIFRQAQALKIEGENK